MNGIRSLPLTAYRDHRVCYLPDGHRPDGSLILVPIYIRSVLDWGIGLQADYQILYGPKPKGLDSWEDVAWTAKVRRVYTSTPYPRIFPIENEMKVLALHACIDDYHDQHYSNV